jgi:hypothetical protein
MTLDDYVDVICMKMHRTDEPSRDEARTYVRARYQTIYESTCWRDLQKIGAVPLGGGQETILPHIVGNVIACRWSTSMTLKNDSLWTVLQIDPTRFDSTGEPVSFSIIAPSGVRATPGGALLHMSTTDSSPDFAVSVYGSYQGEERTESISITGSGIVDSIYQYDEVFSLSKADILHNLSVSRGDTGDQILFLKAHETERIHQRVSFHSTATNTATGLVLYKRAFRPLINGSDSPDPIGGLESALSAFAEADMYQASRQFGKKDNKLQEAVMYVAAMVDLEKNQSANLIRIIPDISVTSGEIENSKEWYIP